MASLPSQQGGAFALPPIPEAAQRILAILDRLDPRQRARTINALIQRLDAADLRTEELEPEDDAGIDDRGEGDEVYDIRPRYGLDQRSEPVNKAEAVRHHRFGRPAHVS